MPLDPTLSLVIATIPMKTPSLLTAPSVLALTLLGALAACGGGGGGGAAAGAALPGALRLNPAGADLVELFVAPSSGAALESDIVLTGSFLEDTSLSMFQVQLDPQGRVLTGYAAEAPIPIVSVVLASQAEHRGSATAFTSPGHVWGGLRQQDGGWCGFIDLGTDKSIVDSVLFEDGGVAVLIHELGPGAGEFSLTYEEYLPDGTPSFTVELPDPFVDGVLPSMGLVQEPGGQESPVIAARQASTAITWIGILDRVSGGVEAFLTSTPVPTPVLDLEVVDAPGSGHAWVVGRRDLGGSEVAEVIEVRTTDDQGAPLPAGPVVERSRAVAFPAGQGFVGFTAGVAFHGAELGEEYVDRLYLSGTTADSTTGDFAPCWLAWELGSDLAPWVRVAVDVTALGQTDFTDIVPSPNPGRVMAAATVISSDGSLATALNEFDASTGGQTVAMYYDTSFIAQGLQRAGDGLALQRVDLSTGNAIGQVEWVAGDLWPEFAVDLQDGPSDGLVELRNPQGAYWQRALVAGGSAEGLYAISLLDPVARAEASAVLTESSPQLGLDEAFFSNVPQMVGLEIPLGALGIQNTIAAPSVITPVPPTPVEFTATEL